MLLEQRLVNIKIDDYPHPLGFEFYKIENYRTLLSLICKERFFVRLKLDLFTFTW